MWQPYVCLASYSLKNHSIWKQGRGSVTFEFGACSKGIVQAASGVSFLFQIFLTLKWECFNRVRARLSFSKSMTFHKFFRDLFTFSMTLSLAVTFKNVQNFPCFKVFFDLKWFNRHKLWCPPKYVPFALFNYSTLSYIVLALSFALSNVANKKLNFHDFQWLKIKFHDFPGLENEILAFHDFPGFPWPVRTLFKVRM